MRGDGRRRAGRAAAASLILTLGASPLWAAAEGNVPFRRITPQQGLPSAAVQQVVQSRDGFIWMATQEGLSRYDGHDFTTYRHDPDDETSLPHNFVWSVLEDDAGSLWVATDGGGIGRFDRATRSFERYRHEPSDPRSLSGDRVRVLVQDRTGGVWVGTDDAGLNRLDPKTGTFERFRHDAGDTASLGGDRVRDLLEDRQGMIWIATDGGGLSVLNPRTGTMTTFRHDEADPHSLGSNRVRSLVEDSTGSIWIGTYDAGLNRYSRAEGSFVRYGLDPADPGSLPSDKVRALLEDTTGTIWVGTDAGLSRFVPGDDSFSTCRHDPANPFSLSHDVVVSLFQDRGGVLWVGTFGGLNTWNVERGTFTLHARKSGESTELSDNWVTAFAEAPDGIVWVGTFGGLNRFDPASGSFDHFRHDPTDDASLSSDRVMSLLVDSRGVLWVGTLGGGLNRFVERSGNFVRFRHDPSDESSLGADGVTSLLEDREGRLWVGTYRGGLNRFDMAAGDFERFVHRPDQPESLSSNRVMSLYEDREGLLWAATEDAGLNRFDSASGRATHFRHEVGDPASLSSDGSWLVTGDDQGNLWIGTRDAGLNRWSAEDRERGRVRFRRYSVNDGLISNSVYAVLAGAANDLWISSTLGLTRLDPSTGVFRQYDASSGLQANEFNYAAAMRAYNGELYFGGIGGFNRFLPGEIRINPRPPSIVLTGFDKLNRPLQIGPPSGDWSEIAIGHRDVAITFHFAALDFTAPEKNRYRYRLEGFDREWVEAGTMRQATYTNLDPGDYVFEVRGSNSDGVWSDEGLAVRLAVAPPPWRTWWAYSLYLLLLGSSVAVGLSSLQRRRRQALALERANVSLRREIRERRAKEAALEAERRRAREYLDVAEVIMLALDESGRVVLINQKGCRIIGLVEDEIVGSEWLSRFVPPAHREEVRQKLADIGAYQYYEYPILTAGGDERIVAWHSAQLPATGRDSAIMLSSGADITQVRELEKQVRFHQKMDALGTLAGGIAHDFNNILTAIFGYSTLTLGTLDRESEQAGYMRHVVKACERAKELVGRILAFSRGGEQDRQPVDVGAVVAEACELLRSSLPASIEVRTEIADSCLPVIGDPTQIHQVIMNLGTNAGHAMPEGGLLEVAVEPIEIEEGAKERPDDLRAGAYLRLTVRDSGQGMDPETLEKAFDPFFTTKGVGQGTGLGLSVVHGIVTGHGGAVSVESAPGRGTTFEVLLPAARVRLRARVEETLDLGGRERILFVDDEEAITQLAKRALERLGHSVTASVDARQALEVLAHDPGSFDVLVTDHAMPALSGLELSRRARELVPDLPIIITSGRRTPELEGDLRFEFLQKPFSVEELGRAVHEVIAARGARDPETVH